MWTKRQIVMEAYGELALAGYEFDITPQEVQTALRRLDSMMATWEGQGIRVGYAMPANPNDSDPDTPSGLPDMAVETVLLNLAVRLAPGNGKALSPETRRTARIGYTLLLTAAANPVQQKLPDTLPQGAGNRTMFRACGPFFPPPRHDPLPVDRSGEMNITQE